MSWRDIRAGNPTKDALTRGDTVIGSFIRSPSTEVVEICAHAGCDFVLIDLEHSTTGWERTAAMIIAAEAGGTTPIARISNPQRDLITRVLDIGAHGVMVAQIDSAESAAAVVAATHYGPDGTRGTAGGRGSGWGLRISMAEFQAAANSATLVSVQIESRLAVDRVHEIAAVDGLDCVFVGTSDLTTDLGAPGEVDHPQVGRALDQIHEACEASGVAVGYPVATSDQAASFLHRGARLIATSETGILARSMSEFIGEVRTFSD